MAASTQTARLARWRPREPGTSRAVTLSLVAHLILATFLSIGISWKNSTPNGVEAELWENVVVPDVKENVTETPKTEEAPVDNKAEIATKKQKKVEEKPKTEKKAESKTKEKEKPKEKEKVKPSDEKLKQKPQESPKKNVSPQEKERQERLAKLRAMAGEESGSGGTTGSGVGSGGTASPGYGDKVRRKVKPYITYNIANVRGNPEATILVELAPDGTIINKRLIKSSGDDGWDNAVIKALELAKSLPKDDDGKAPREIKLKFKPKDFN